MLAIDFSDECSFTGAQMLPAARPDTTAEIAPDFLPRTGVTHVVFDFDGTLSWLRHGWPDVMKDIFVELARPSKGQPDSALESSFREAILALNGKPSIFQIQHCSAMLRQLHVAPPADPLLLAEYERRLEHIITERTAAIQERSLSPDALLVHGARHLLDLLRERGLTLIVLSGTNESRVRQEAQLLGLVDYFGSHIYGSTSDRERSSKEAVLGRLMSGEHLAGEHLLSFGDGPVEIELAKKAGGLAVGVASDEHANGSGKMDMQKKQLLVRAGADLVIPDYRQPAALLERLLGAK